MSAALRIEIKAIRGTVPDCLKSYFCLQQVLLEVVKSSQGSLKRCFFLIELIGMLPFDVKLLLLGESA